jgi:hypothetical protein
MWLYFGLGLFDYEQLCQIFSGGLVEHMAMSCRQLIALYVLYNHFEFGFDLYSAILSISITNL